MTNVLIASSAARIDGLHLGPDLRGWASPGSIALAPVPEPVGTRWTLWSLLADPIRLCAARLTYRPAWGAVQWEWPSGQLRQRLRLAAALFPTGAAGLWSVRPDDDAVARRTFLLERLAALVGSHVDGAAHDLPALADTYRGLLPQPAYAAYHTLVPGSAAWLRP